MASRGQEGNPSLRESTAYDYSDRPVIPILIKLYGVRACGSGWLAQCPAHPDRNPSLSVAEGPERQALLYCHAGCYIEDILDSINLDLKDLQPRLRAGRRRPAPPLPDFYRDAAPVHAEQRPARDRSHDLRFFQSLLRPGHLEQFSQQIRIPPHALDEFDLGVSSSDAYGDCIIIPERDENRIPIGLLRRYTDGHKMALPGSRRGLIIPRYCFYRSGPVCVPEGFTDTVVLTLAGFPAVGRPSANGGTEFLVGLFRSIERDILIIGENDQKEDGRWPGRDGAARVAAELADRLGRTVRWILPPTGCKDARSVYCLGGVQAIQNWLLSQNS